MRNISQMMNKKVIFDDDYFVKTQKAKWWSSPKLKTEQPDVETPTQNNTQVTDSHLKALKY